MKDKLIILSLIGVVFGTLSCFNPSKCVTVTIDKISTEQPESLGRIFSIWYSVQIHNHCKDTVRYYHRTDKQITIKMIPEYRDTVFVPSNIYLTYRNDTIHSNTMGGFLSINWEFPIPPNQNHNIVFIPNAWIVSELYKIKYVEEFETKEDFWLDIVKHGVLHVVVDGKTHRVKNHGLSLEFNEED
jgi:hypothetical protein